MTRTHLPAKSTLMQFDACTEQLQLKFPLSFRRPPSDTVSDPKSDGTIFPLVANFWDGISVVTQSRVLRIDGMQQNGSTTMAQSFQTAGAREFHSFKIRNQTYMALANYAEHSSIFTWQAGVPISNLTIVDPGSGYLDGMFKLTCRQRPSGSGGDDSSAMLVVNETSGSIVDVYNYIWNHGEGYLADRDGNAALTSNVQFEAQVYIAGHFEVTGIPRIDPAGTLTFCCSLRFPKAAFAFLSSRDTQNSAEYRLNWSNRRNKTVISGRMIERERILS